MDNIDIFIVHLGKNKRLNIFCVHNNKYISGVTVKSTVLISISNISCFPNIFQVESLPCLWTIFRSKYYITSSVLSAVFHSYLNQITQTLVENFRAIIGAHCGPAVSTQVTSCSARSTEMTEPHSLPLAPLSRGKMLTP